MLHATLRAARPLGLFVAVLHVHHGLMPQADAWLAALRRRCARLRAAGHAVGLRVERLEGAPAAGESIEAWARVHRYAALRRLANGAGATLVLLAHHRRDQAETVLLQLLRAAGPAGLAAMPRRIEREGIVWARPWLEQPRERIDAYLKRWRLSFVEDPSNLGEASARGQLRAGPWPALEQTFPSLEPALCQAARRAQQASAALEELAHLDLARCDSGDGALDVAALLALSLPRQANLLRHWWQTRTGRGATDALIERLLQELPACAQRRRPARWPAAGTGAGGQAGAAQVTFYRGRLEVDRGSSTGHRPPPVSGISSNASLCFVGPGAYAVAPWVGRLIIEPVASRGLAALALSRCEARHRGGGERFQLSASGLPRSLKKQYQQRGVPEWAREGPLLFSAGQLVFAPALGIDARAWAPEGEPQWSLRWLAGEPSGQPG